MDLKTYIFALLIFPSSLLAKDLGTFGRTYPIIELDMVVTLQNNAKKVDWKKVFDPDKLKKKVEIYRPKDLADPLPLATKSRVFYPDMTATVHKDIVGRDGNIIYPKGFKYNPASVIRLTNIYIVINAKDPKQILWYKNSEYYQKLNIKILATDAKSFTKLSAILNRPAFYLNKQVASRFQIKAVPSVIRQEFYSRKIKVEEIQIPTEQEQNKKQTQAQKEKS